MNHLKLSRQQFCLGLLGCDPNNSVVLTRGKHKPKMVVSGYSSRQKDKIMVKIRKAHLQQDTYNKAVKFNEQLKSAFHCKSSSRQKKKQRYGQKYPKLFSKDNNLFY